MTTVIWIPAGLDLLRVYDGKEVVIRPRTGPDREFQECVGVLKIPQDRTMDVVVGNVAFPREHFEVCLAPPRRHLRVVG